jgi:hypothetical protein
MPIHQQNPDGTWTRADAIPMQGWKARLEERLRRRGWKRLPNLLARRDERGLG